MEGKLNRRRVLQVCQLKPFRLFAHTMLVSLAIVVLLLAATESCFAQKVAEQSDAKYAWREALVGFEETGPLIEAEKFDEALEKLDRQAELNDEPYSSLARRARQRIAELLEPRTDENDPFGSAGHTSDREILNGYYWYMSLGDICSSIHAYRSAANLYWKAFHADPSGSAGRNLSRLIAYAMGEAGELEKLHGLLEIEGPKKECLERIALLKEKHARQKDVDYVLEHPPGAGLSTLAELDRISATIKNNDQKLALYTAFIHRLKILKDFRGRDAWEDAVLTDFADNIAACAVILETRAMRTENAMQFSIDFEKFKEFSFSIEQPQEACAKLLVRRASAPFGETIDERRKYSLDTLDRVINEFPNSSQVPVAHFEIGKSLQVAGQYEDAIAAYKRKIKIEGSATSAEIANNLSKCYEATGKPALALKWARHAHEEHPLHSFCGTCQSSYEIWTGANLTRLMFLAGESEDATSATKKKMLDPSTGGMLSEDVGGHSLWRGNFKTVIDDYITHDNVQELKAELSTAIANRQKRLREELADHPDLLAKLEKGDPRSSGILFADEYLNFKQLAKQKDIEKLWNVLLNSETNALRALAEDGWYAGKHWKTHLAAENLQTLGEPAVQFCREKLSSAEIRERGWACVILVKLKAFTQLEQVEQELKKLAYSENDHKLYPDQLDARDQVRQDLIYAMLLIDEQKAIEAFKSCRANGDDRWGTAIWHTCDVLDLLYFLEHD